MSSSANRPDRIYKYTRVLFVPEVSFPRYAVIRRNLGSGRDRCRREFRVIRASTILILKPSQKIRVSSNIDRCRENEFRSSLRAIRFPKSVSKSRAYIYRPFDTIETNSERAFETKFLHRFSVNSSRLLLIRVDVSKTKKSPIFSPPYSFRPYFIIEKGTVSRLRLNGRNDYEFVNITRPVFYIIPYWNV